MRHNKKHKVICFLACYYYYYYFVMIVECKMKQMRTNSRVGHHILSTETLYYWEEEGVTEKHFNE